MQCRAVYLKATKSQFLAHSECSAVRSMRREKAIIAFTKCPCKLQQKVSTTSVDFSLFTTACSHLTSLHSVQRVKVQFIW